MKIGLFADKLNALRLKTELLRNKLRQYKTYINIFLLLLLTLLLELFVFNYRYWQSRGNQEVHAETLYYGAGLEKQKNGSFSTVNDESRTFDFRFDGQYVNTIFFDIEFTDNGERKDLSVPLYFHLEDESHKEYYWVPDQYICQSQESSQYLNLHCYGKCNRIMVTPALDTNLNFKLTYRFNVEVPMFFSISRVLCVFAIMLFLYLFRPKSIVYRIRFLKIGNFRKVAVCVFMIAHVLLFIALVRVNPVFWYDNNQTQYQELAEALSKGSFSLLAEPGETLLSMENPYDFAYRTMVMNEAQENYLWDHAFFNGKYYVYFGVIPCILFYLPYYLITGLRLHNWVVILIGAVLMLIAILGIMSQIIKKWFPKTSVGAWYLLSELTVLGSCMIYMCKRPDLYTVPIILGWAFGLLGMWCFLKADNDGHLNWKLVALGSFLTALVAGCRPQLFLILFISVYILRKYIFSWRYLISKEGIKNVLAFCLPMLGVAAFLMYYNAARFGSPFDFGANYNLTMNDMRHRGFILERIPTGIFMYLFAPIKLESTFPFIRVIFYSPLYLGDTIAEDTFGGAIATNLFFIMPFLLFIYRKTFKKKPACTLALMSLLIAFVIVIVDTEMSGILIRYFSDFAWFFSFSAVLSWLLFYTRAKKKKSESLAIVFLLICMISVFAYQFLQFFVDTGAALMAERKDLFQAVKYQIMFWV